MKKLLTILSIAAIVCGATAQKSAPMPKFVDAVSFYISFDDETADADITEGRHKPMVVRGKKVFAEGIRGKAALCGQNGAQYAGALGTNKDNKRMAALASSIALRIQTGNPVPVRWLLEYNKLVTDDGGEG